MGSHKANQPKRLCHSTVCACAYVHVCVRRGDFTIGRGHQQSFQYIWCSLSKFIAQSTGFSQLYWFISFQKDCNLPQVSSYCVLFLDFCYLKVANNPAHKPLNLKLVEGRLFCVNMISALPGTMSMSSSWLWQLHYIDWCCVTVVYTVVPSFMCRLASLKLC